MNMTINNGVWPTMITPFNDRNEIDFNALEELIEWYLAHRIDGLFAVCQSSEMFKLSFEERIKLACFVVRKVNGRIPVIASGHISDTIEEQIEEIKAVGSTGVDAVVLVTNRLAAESESEDVWKKNAEIIMESVPEIPMGFYECPYPYKRVMSPELLKWCADTKRFLFLKDTCCDVEQIRKKYEAVKRTELKIFNANAATLFETLKLGIAGYSGVMANFHPELYVWLLTNWKSHLEKAGELQAFLGFSSLVERQIYPVNAKYFLQLEGINISTNTRTRDIADFTAACKLEIEQFLAVSKKYSEIYRG